MGIKSIFSCIFILIIGLSSKIYGQNELVFEVAFEWNEQSYIKNILTGEQDMRIGFKGAEYDRKSKLSPVFSKRFKVSKPGKLKVSIEEYTLLGESPYDKIDKIAYEKELSKQLNDKLQFIHSVDQNRREFYGKFSFHPVMKTNTGIKFIETAKIKVTHYPTAENLSKNPNKETSVLSDGDIYKLKISETGIYKLNANYLSATLGINLNNVNPSNIQIFGNRGGFVARAISEERVDDLEELSIEIVGDSDGKIDGADAIYFFATGPEVWDTNEDNSAYKYQANPYSTDNYVFLKISDTEGKRIQKAGSSSSDLESVDFYLEKTRHEQNLVNILANNFSTLGSGTEWYGETFNQQKIQDFSSKFKINNVKSGELATFKTNFVGRAFTTNKIEFRVNDSKAIKSISSVSKSLYHSEFARTASLEIETILDEGNPTIVLDHSQNSSAEGWLDFIEVQYRRLLNFGSSQLNFGNTGLVNENAFSFKMSNASQATVWDVSKNGFAKEMNVEKNGQFIYFDCENDKEYSYQAFNKSASLLQPTAHEKIENQNLHSIKNTDIIIVTVNDLLPAVEKFAAHRTQQDGYSIQIVDVEQVYNEFSGGRVDPTAIRDLFKMVYDRDENFRYGILFGNGSYDYKGIVYDKEKYNLVPVYETPLSLDPIESFPSDDYFGLLSPQDGDDLKGEVDLAIGRFPVANLNQANLMVDKIIKYETDPAVRGPWNLRSVFMADDEDTNLHITPADAISEDFLNVNPNINLEKIYFDSYPQQSTPGGERYPDVTEEINSNIFRGSLTFCYMGHGGPSGFAQERVLQIDNIDNWKNDRSYPLFITATCSLASYDDPEVFSAGEKVVVNKNGGIGLFTTSRAVYSSDNARLTRAVHDFLIKKDENDKHYKLGEILRNAKNSSQGDTLRVNARKFLLLGDPSMDLLYPTLDVVTSEINGQDVILDTLQDTISSLSQMSIKGFIADNGEKIENYNGEIYVTVFDKRTTRKTLEQDPGSLAKNFKVQKNLLFKGKAKVTNGDFELEFIVPKDILFNVGKGKISYYATNGKTEAVGNFQEFNIGGSSDNSIEDDTPPVVQVFMNDENFVSGGLTNNEPIMLAKIVDDKGINLSGSSVGHDLTGILDNKTSDSYYLNDFFESELNNFAKGTVRYPLIDLEEGVHTIKVRAWDIANNVGEGSTEFVVSNNLDGGLEHVLNYPNPFTDNTCFMFEHNLGPDIMDIQIDVYTISGKLVKSILHSSAVEGFRVDDIKWNGLDDFGNKLGRGVYLYKIKLRAQSQNVTKESDFEKLVILK